jgi:tetratricopeptide (TPR) repeat protein
MITGFIEGRGEYHFLQAGRFGEARLLFEEAIHAYLTNGGQQFLPRARYRLGKAELLSGRYDEARTHLEAAHALARAADGNLRAAASITRFQLAYALLGLGMIHLVGGEYADARERLQESLVLCRERGCRPFEVEQRAAFLAYAALGLGFQAEAEQHLRLALGSAARIPDAEVLASALPALALLLLARGEVEGAVELQGLGSRHPLLSKARFYEDIAWRHVRATAAELPAEVVAAAQARGQARDLYTTAAEFLAELGG